MSSFSRTTDLPVTVAVGGTRQLSVNEPVIFLVHGRDHHMREAAARLLERTAPGPFRPLILEELANKGRTIIEKLEQYTSRTKFAIVLLTADDVGGLNERELEPRARQNVVLELGWFCGALGRDKVVVLCDRGIEPPSDIEGLLCLSFNADWERLLIRELRAAGWDFSLDRLDLAPPERL